MGTLDIAASLQMALPLCWLEALHWHRSSHGDRAIVLLRAEDVFFARADGQAQPEVPVSTREVWPVVDSHASISPRKGTHHDGISPRAICCLS